MYWMNQSIYLLHTFMYDRFYIFSEVTVPPRHFFVEKLARCFAVEKWAPFHHFTLNNNMDKKIQKMQLANIFRFNPSKRRQWTFPGIFWLGCNAHNHGGTRAKLH